MNDQFSPDGIYLVRISLLEMAMSHWVFEPAIYRVSDNVQLFNMGKQVWSSDSIEWTSNSIVVLKTRQYPGLIFCDLTLDMALGMGKAIRGKIKNRDWKTGNPMSELPAEFTGTLAEIKEWLS
ncbi:hypothetical protein GCM10028818_61360 [Spirosoma horti]